MERKKRVAVPMKIRRELAQRRPRVVRWMCTRCRSAACLNVSESIVLVFNGTRVTARKISQDIFRSALRL
jgi:hypothetical protein